MIYVMDELNVRAGKLDVFTSRFAQRYVPGASARGLKLLGCWTTPPASPEGESSQVIVLWSLEDARAFWRQKHRAGQDPAVDEWWREAGDWLVSRSRRYLAAAPFSPMQ